MARLKAGPVGEQLEPRNFSSLSVVNPPRGCLAAPSRGTSPLVSDCYFRLPAFHPLWKDGLPWWGRREVTSTLSLAPIDLPSSPPQEGGL